MSEHRINPETGVIEENGSDLWNAWHPAKNENDLEERVNLETGVVEENGSDLWDAWRPKE